MALQESVNLYLIQKLPIFGPEFIAEACKETSNLLDHLLKVLLQEKGVVSAATKLNVASFIELESPYLLTDIAEVELVFATFKNVFQGASGDSCSLLQGQCLISTTTVLLQASEKLPEEEFKEMLSDHLHFLMAIVQKTNNASDVYVRSVAANCLIELELCYPLVLRFCLDTIYLLSVEETSPAHQHYMALLALVLKHSLSTTLWGKSQIVQFKSNIPQVTHGKLEISDLNQMVSFLMDQLSLCTCEVMTWIVSKVIDMMLLKDELQVSVQVLKPLLFSYAHTYNTHAFHIVLMMESRLGSILFQERDHTLLLRQLVLNASHPALPACVKLMYLDFLGDYLTRRPHTAASLQNTAVLLPGSFDGPETQLKKLQLLSALLIRKEGSSAILLQAVNSHKKQIRCRTSIKLKSSLLKSLYRFLCDHPHSDMADEVSGLLLSSTIEDITLAPFTLNIVQCVQEQFPDSSIPQSMLTSLVAAYARPDSQTTLATLHFVLSIFFAAVTHDSSSDQSKAILSYILKYVMCDEVCEVLSWTLGHQILGICFNLMKEYDPNDFFYELCGVLKAFGSKCDDVDLQDRAQLYYTLVVSLSYKKLKSLLKAQKQSVRVMLSDENTFDSKSSVKMISKPLLRLHKVKYAVATTMVQQVNDDPQIFPTDVLQQYRHFVNSVASKNGMSVKVTLDFTPEFDANIQVIEALVVSFSPPQIWGRIDPIMVGHFSKGKRKMTEQNYALDIVCFPTNPHPVLAQVSAEFSIEDICHICPLEPLQIEFSNFFNPLPICDNWIYSVGVWRQRLFHVLWQSLAESVLAFTSVHVMHCLKQEATHQIQDKLENFIIEHDTAEDLYHVGIYLPPEKHLLMKCQITEERTIITMITDEIHILAYTNDFFKTWE